MKSTEIIYYLNWEEDSKFFDKEKEREYIQLELGKSLYSDLCQMVAQQFQLMKELMPVSSHHHELHQGAYEATIYSLVYKWELEQSGLLTAWSELGCRLARSQYFTNVKRTALLSMITFVHACGFRLKDDENNKFLLKKQ